MLTTNSNKEVYTSPATDLIVVRIERTILNGSTYSSDHTEYLGNEEDGGNL